MGVHDLASMIWPKAKVSGCPRFLSSGAIFADPLGRRYQVTEIPPGTVHRPGRGRPK
jgi:hypothetical protein